MGTAKLRPNSIDYAKVLMIYLVVVGHYTYAVELDFKPSAVWSLMHMITLFHMPFFFFVSGILFKVLSVKEAYKKGWGQIILPYIYMSIIGCVTLLIFQIIKQQFAISNIPRLALGVISGYDIPNSMKSWSASLWFCYSLFTIKIIISYLLKIKSQFFRLVGGTVLMAFMAVVLYSGNIAWFRIDSSIIGCFFFSCGFFFKDAMIKIWELRLPYRVGIAIIAVVILCISAYYNLDLNIRQGLSINALYFGPFPWLFLVSGICGTLVVLILSSLVSFNNSLVKKIILQLSNGTIVILGFHWLVYKFMFCWWLKSYNVGGGIFNSTPKLNHLLLYNHLSR